GRERVQERRGLVAERDAVDGHAGDVGEFHPGDVAPGVGIAPQVALPLEGEQQGVDRALRKIELARELRECQAAPRLRNPLEDRQPTHKGRYRRRLRGTHAMSSFCPECGRANALYPACW